MYQFEWTCFVFQALKSIEVNKIGILMSEAELGRWILDLTKDASWILLDFSSADFSMEDHQSLLGMSKEDFNDLHRICHGWIHNSANRSSKNALGIFLMKLRLNIPQKVIGILFGIENQSTVSDTIDTVSRVLDEHFVPSFLGYDH